MKKKDNNAQATEPVEEQVVQEPETEAAEEAQAAAEETEASIDEWRAALETAVKQRDEYLDSLRRSQAEFQNFRRRNQTARSDGYQDGVRESLTAMLPVIDNLERALDAAKKSGESESLTGGVEMILSMMMSELGKLGLEEVPALGEDFDPELHNAVMREAGDEPGKILEVFQKGYRVKDKIIRYAMVKVCAD